MFIKLPSGTFINLAQIAHVVPGAGNRAVHLSDGTCPPISEEDRTVIVRYLDRESLALVLRESVPLTPEEIAFRQKGVDEANRETAYYASLGKMINADEKYNDGVTIHGKVTVGGAA